MLCYKNCIHQEIQQKPNSFHPDLTPEYPASSLPDKESEQPSCFQPKIGEFRIVRKFATVLYLSNYWNWTASPFLDSLYKHPAFGNTSDRSEPGKTAGHSNHFNRRYPAEYFQSSPAPYSHTNKREKLEQPLVLNRREELDEKEKHRSQQGETTDISPPRDTYLNPTAEPEHSGSHGRKRQLEGVSSIQCKRVKQEIVDDRSDPSPLSTTHTMPEQHINTHALSGLYPNSSRCHVTRTLVSYLGSDMHPHQTASWDPIGGVHKIMDLYSRQHLLKDYSLNTCRAIRVPPVAMRQKESFGYYAPPFYFPLALMQQQSFYLSSRHMNSHLHHPGWLTTSYLRPWEESR